MAKKKTKATTTTSTTPNLGLTLGGGLPGFGNTKPAFGDPDWKFDATDINNDGINDSFQGGTDKVFEDMENKYTPTEQTTPPTFGPLPSIKDGQIVEPDTKVDTGLGSGDTGHITIQKGEGTTTDIIPGTDVDDKVPTTPSTPKPAPTPTSTPTPTPTPEPVKKPEVTVLAPGEEYVPPKPTVKPQVYMNDAEVKDAFSYEDRKKYNLDWDSTKTYKRPDGSYVIQDAKGNVYIASGEGEGMKFDKRHDWRDFDDDGKVSFGEKLAGPFAGIYYGGKELASGAKSLFTNPSEKTKKWAGDFKETVNMLAGGADELGLTRKGEVADRNGDGEVDAGERFVNVVGDLAESAKDTVSGINDAIVNGQVDVLVSLMEKTGKYTPEQIEKTKEGMKIGLGMTNGIILTALSPLIGLPHLASGIVDLAQSPAAKKNMEQNSNMRQELYGTTPSTPTNTTVNGANDIVPPTTSDEVADIIAKVGYDPTRDTDELAIEASQRHEAETTGDSAAQSKLDKVAKMRIGQEEQFVKDKEAFEERKTSDYNSLETRFNSELTALNNAMDNELSNVGPGIGILPSIRANREKDSIRSKYDGLRADLEAKYGKMREELDSKYKSATPSDKLLKNYITQSVINEKDPLKMLIGLRLMRQM